MMSDDEFRRRKHHRIDSLPRMKVASRDPAVRSVGKVVFSIRRGIPASLMTSSINKAIRITPKEKQNSSIAPCIQNGRTATRASGDGTNSCITILVSKAKSGILPRKLTVVLRTPSTWCLLLDSPHTLFKTWSNTRRRSTPTLHSLLKRRHVTLTPRMHDPHRIRSQPQTPPLNHLIFLVFPWRPSQLILSPILISSIQTRHTFLLLGFLVYEVEGLGVEGVVSDCGEKGEWWCALDSLRETRRGWVGRMKAGVPGRDSSVNPGRELGARAIGGNGADLCPLSLFPKVTAFTLS